MSLTLNLPDAAFDELDDLGVSDVEVEGVLGNEETRDRAEE